MDTWHHLPGPATRGGQLICFDPNHDFGRFPFQPSPLPFPATGLTPLGGAAEPAVSPPQPELGDSPSPRGEYPGDGEPSCCVFGRIPDEQQTTSGNTQADDQTGPQERGHTAAGEARQLDKSGRLHGCADRSTAKHFVHNT